MRWIWRFFAFVLLLTVLAIAALFVIPTDRIADLAADRFQAATGRSLDMDGDIRPSLWPVLGLKTGAIRIENAQWAGPAPMIEAQGLSIGVDPASLFGTLKITSIEIDTPTIRLSTDENGRSNLDFGANRPTNQIDASGGQTWLPSLDLARITNATVTIESQNGASLKLDSVDIEATLPDVEGPLDVSLSGASMGQSFSGAGTLSGARDFVGGTPVPVTASIRLDDALATFSGTAGLSPLELSGELAVEAGNPASVAGLFGLPTPAIPEGLGQEQIAATASLRLADAQLQVQNLVATLDHNRIQGEANIALGGARPVVDAALRLGDFDLSALATAGQAASDTSGPPQWSRSPIDLSALGLIDGRISVDATSLELGTASIDALATRTQIENARSVTEITRLQAYDGAATGTLVLNARDGFSTRLAIEGSAFAISRLLSELVGYDRIVAAGDLRLDVLGVGNTMDALMNALNGNGSFRVGAGELLGLDIVGMLRNLDPSYMGQGNTTIFDEITGTFRIVDGVVINDDLRLTAPLFRASGAGRIGIGAQSLDLRLVPELLGGDNAGIRVPLLVTGTWDKPKLRLDLEGALTSRVEDEVRQRVEQEIGNAIGSEAGNSLEDALKEGLGNLLGR